MSLPPSMEPTRQQPAYPPENNGDSTQPVPVRRSPSGHRRMNRLWLLAIPILAIVTLAVSVSTGYMQGLRQRSVSEAASEAAVLQEQMNKAIDDLAVARYELARQRFEYILSVDPNYPGASDLLAQSLAAMNEPTSTASPVASPTQTPTVDMSSYEGIFQSAQSAFTRGDWTTTLDLLLVLRAEDPTYRLAEVNSMMAGALRGRGMEKLMNTRLEQGIYDLTLAERFGPLDGQAASWRNSAQFYIFANSYFGLDPGLAAEYFGQICEAGIWGACRKFGESSIEYANRLVLEKSPDVCQIVQWYEQGYAYALDEKSAPTATKVGELCQTATAPVPTGSITPTAGTLTPTVTSTGIILPSATPSETPAGPPSPTPSPTTGGAPSSTPTASPTATLAETPTPTDTPIP